MNYLNQIPLGGLRAIEVLARLGSLRAAADELGVTIGAVNQQVLRCEEALGRKAFLKQGRKLVLSKFGREIAPHLTEGMARLEAAVAKARQKSHETLTISVAPIFASRWLVWRIAKFYALHPKMRVRVDADVSLVDPRNADVDACIRVGRGEWPGVHAEWLADQEVFPVCSPELAKRLKMPRDLAGVPIITEPRAAFSWGVWLAPNSMKESDLGPGPIYSDASLCLDAAKASQGVFLAWSVLARDSLNAGHLVAPFPGRYRTGISYWFVTQKDKPVNGPLKDFLDWLKVELAAGD